MKKSVLFLCVVLAVAFFTTCGRDAYDWKEHQNPDPHSQNTVLRFESPWGEKSLKGSILNQMLQDFMKQNPQVEVINESMTGGNFLEKVMVDFASGNEPDLFAMWPGYNSNLFIDMEKVADLTPLLEQRPAWRDSFDKSVWYHVTSPDSRVYGIPLEMTYQCLFVNTDLFEAYHIPLPVTWEALKNAVVQFRAQGIVPIEYSAQNKNAYLFENIAAALGGSTGVTEPVTGGEMNPYYRQAIGYMQELYSLGAFPEDFFDMSNKNRDLFLNKKAAMCVQTSDFIGELNQLETTFQGKNTQTGTQKSSVDMLTFPKIPEGNADETAIIYGVGSGTFSISQSAWNSQSKQAAAGELLCCLTSDEAAQNFAEATGMLVSKRGAGLRQSYYGALLKKGLYLIDATREPIVPIENTVERNAWEDVLVSRLPSVVSGAGDAEEMWNEMVQRHQWKRESGVER